MLAAEGGANTRIAELTDATVTTVLNWRGRYEERGIARPGERAQARTATRARPSRDRGRDAEGAAEEGNVVSQPRNIPAHVLPTHEHGRKCTPPCARADSCPENRGLRSKNNQQDTFGVTSDLVAVGSADELDELSAVVPGWTSDHRSLHAWYKWPNILDVCAGQHGSVSQNYDI